MTGWTVLTPVETRKLVVESQSWSSTTKMGAWRPTPFLRLRGGPQDDFVPFLQEAEITDVDNVVAADSCLDLMGVTASDYVQAMRDSMARTEPQRSVGGTC